MLLSQMTLTCLQAALVTNPNTSFFPWNLYDYPATVANALSNGQIYPQGVPRSAVLAAYQLLAGVTSGGPAVPSTLLGAASAYAVLAQAGITNTGNTVITGGTIGSNPTVSITGFPPGTATIDNNNAAAALTAAKSAYLQFQGLAFTSISSSTADLTALGNGATASTWLPGNYSAGSSMSAATPITLDAGGNANATWVFKSGSTVGFTSTGAVLLVNGAQAQNVVWIVGSSFTEDTIVGRAMVGLILANTSITLGGGTLAGVAFAGMVAPSGAVTISAATTITAPAAAAAPGGLTGTQNFIYAPGIWSSSVLNNPSPALSQSEIAVPAGLQPSPQTPMPMTPGPSPAGGYMDGKDDFVTLSSQVR